MSDSESEEDVLGWIEKNRKLKEQRELAEKQAKLLKQQLGDESDSDSDPVAFREEKRAKKAGHAPRSSHNVAAGLRVAHNAADILKEGGAILTLKDKKILNDGESEDSEDDELESVQLVEAEKRKHHAELKAGKGKYNVYDEEDPGDDVLTKYNDVNKPKKYSFVLNAKGMAVEDPEEQNRRAEQELAEKQREKSKVDGALKLIKANDFFTKDEITTFRTKKKEKKPKKKRKTLSDELVPLEGQTKGNDLGSRATRASRHHEAKIQDVIDALEKRNSYREAIEKANEDAKWAFHPDEDEDDDFYRSLSRAKKLAARAEKTNHEEELLQSVEHAKAVTAQEEPASDSKDTIFFTSATEFVKGVPTQAEQEDEEFLALSLKKKIKEKRGIQAFSDTRKPEVKLEPIEDDEMDLEEEVDVKQEDLLGHENVAANKGLGATLAYLNSRGGKDTYDLNSVRKRVADSVVSANEDKDEIILEYRDKRGKEMSAKEAFRYQSYTFHGKAPGKKKVEKQLKREEIDLQKKKMTGDDVTDTRLSILQQTTKASQTPYVILDGTTSKILEQKRRQIESQKEAKLEKQLAAAKKESKSEKHHK